MKRFLKKTGNLIMTAALMAALLVCACAVPSAAAAANKVTKAEAKQIALKRANVKNTDVKKWTKVKLDNWDNDKAQEWDVEFRTATHKYEVEVNARTGKVEDFEKKKIGSGKNPGTNNGNTSKMLTQARAREIALNKAGVKSTDVTQWTKEKLDGNEWEMKFRTAEYAYEVDINALTGTVKDFEKKKIGTGNTPGTNVPDTSVPGTNGGNTGRMLTQAEARAAALSAAGVKSTDVKKWIKERLDGDEWDMQFQTAEYVYEVDVNAYTGRVELEKKELRPNVPDTSVPGTNGGSTGKMLTQAEARAAALSAAGVTSADVKQWIKERLDGDEWDIKFQTAEYVYEVDINAYTGRVELEKKELRPNVPDTNTGTMLTLEEAKAKALAHAKANASINGNVVYTKAKLDWDDGRQIYEIEFRSGRLEFEYEIDAYSGAILKWDSDYDD